MKCMTVVVVVTGASQFTAFGGKEGEKGGSGNNMEEKD
jgi:hypothetical protein